MILARPALRSSVGPRRYRSQRTDEVFGTHRCRTARPEWCRGAAVALAAVVRPGGPSGVGTFTS